jgi:hypothetical protein
MRTRTAIFAAFALAGLASGAHAQQPPTFADCPATVQAKRFTPRLTFADAPGRKYRTVIQDAAKGPIDFAGHYILATWGCGAGCVMAAAIDAQSGRVTSLPFTVSDWPLDVTEPLSYHADSCRLIVRGSRNESAGHGTYYYAFDGKAFRLRAADADADSRH